MEEMYYYWLHNVAGIGRITLQKILQNMTPKELYEYDFGTKENNDIEKLLTKTQRNNLIISKNNWDILGEWEILRKRNTKALGLRLADYPSKLVSIPDPPPILYCKGNEKLLHRPSVAVIGARVCSNYGSLLAKELGRQLAHMGIIVVSGMARGVDSICQISCLEHGGESVAVLGSGVEVCYPPENRDLYFQLQTKGALVSENTPFTKPSPGLFPLRNRIISGLADMIVVIEAREKSGTLITVDMALEQGKEVFVVPGRITDPVSKGCNKLIKQGAGIIVSIEEFVEEICPLMQIKYQKKDGFVQNNLAPYEQKIIKMIDVSYKSLEEIYQGMLNEDSDVSINKIMEWLLGMQLKQVIKEENGYYFRNKLAVAGKD
ncbi:MAG: DNA-processing protein DprA [Lachnospiraceae bacterium]|nr:DNA-processing protein DprA [Lachnospiraceae bacterium]